MTSPQERYEQRQSRMRELEAEFERAARSPLEALSILTPLCRPDGFLDLMRARAAVYHLGSHPALPHRELREQLRPGGGFEAADGLLYLGAVEEAEARYLEMGALNDALVCAFLKGESGLAERGLRRLLELDARVAVRYNLALLLFLECQLTDALTEFKRCRGSCLHYRDVEYFVAEIRDHLGGRGGSLLSWWQSKPTPLKPFF